MIDQGGTVPYALGRGNVYSVCWGTFSNMRENCRQEEGAEPTADAHDNQLLIPPSHSSRGLLSSCRGGQRLQRSTKQISGPDIDPVTGFIMTT